MRHKARRLRLNQKPAHAALLKRNLVTSVLLYETIRTTRKRARVIQPLVDNLITLSKKGNGQANVRAINNLVADTNASRKLIQVLAKRYEGRTSGFTRMVAVGARKGDGAELVDLTLIDADLSPKTAPVAEKKVKAEKKPAKKATSKKTSDSEASA